MFNLQEKRVQVAGSGMAGSMLGGGVMEGLGYQNPEQQKQQAINEVWQEVGHLDLDDDNNRKIVGNAFIAKNLPDIGMDILQYDDKTKTTSNPYLDAKRERNELALRLQQAYGNMDGLADKKKFKQQLIEAGVGDSSVFTSIVTEINTLTSANINQDKDTANRLEKLANQMIKNGVPEIESALVEFEGLQAKYKNNLPGIGIDAMSPSLEAKEMGSAFTQIKNMVLKERSGAAVTNPEFKRLIEEIKGVYFTTDADAIRWVSRIRKTIERVKGTIFSGYGSAVKETYWKGDNSVQMYVEPESGVINWSDIK